MRNNFLYISALGRVILLMSAVFSLNFVDFLRFLLICLVVFTTYLYFCEALRFF